MKLSLTAKILSTLVLASGFTQAAQSVQTTSPNLYYVPGVLLFLVALAFIAIGYKIKQAPFIVVGGILWIVLGLMILTGQAVQTQSTVQTNYTYANFTSLSNVTNSSGAVLNTTVNLNPYVISQNQTTIFTPLNNSNDYFTNAFLGGMGYSLIGLGIFILYLGFMQNKFENQKKEDEEE